MQLVSGPYFENCWLTGKSTFGSLAFKKQAEL